MATYLKFSSVVSWIFLLKYFTQSIPKYNPWIVQYLIDIILKDS